MAEDNPEATGQTVLEEIGVWQRIMDDEQHADFYFNTVSGESLWDRPESFGWESAQDEDAGKTFWLYRGDQHAYLWSNPAWRVGTDDDTGNRYWYNADTDASTWDRPDDYASDTEEDRVRMEEEHDDRESETEAADVTEPQAPPLPPPPPPSVMPQAEASSAPGPSSDGPLASARGGAAQRVVRTAAVVVLDDSGSESDESSDAHAVKPAIVRRKSGKTAAKTAKAAPAPALAQAPAPAPPISQIPPTAASLPPPPAAPVAKSSLPPPPPAPASAPTSTLPPPPAPLGSSSLPPLTDAVATRLLQRVVTDAMLRRDVPILRQAGPADLAAARQVLEVALTRAEPGELLAEEGRLATGGALVVLEGDVSSGNNDSTGARIVVPAGTIVFGDSLLSGSYRYDRGVRATVGGKGAYVGRLSLHALQDALGQDWLVQRAREALENDASVLPSLLQPVPFLASHRAESAPVLMELSLVVQRPALHLVIQEVSPVDGFFVLLLGSARVAVEGRVVAECGPGAFFGEMSMIGAGDGDGAAGGSSDGAAKSQLASASVVTTSPSLLLCVPRWSFGALLSRCPGIRDELKQHAIRRTALNLKGIGSDSPLSVATETQLHALAARAAIETYAPGAYVAKRGDPSGKVAIVLSGVIGEQEVARGLAKDTSALTSSLLPGLSGQTKTRQAGDMVSADVLARGHASVCSADAVVQGSEPARIMRFSMEDLALALGGEDGIPMALVQLKLRARYPRPRDVAGVPRLLETLLKYATGKVRSGAMQLLAAARKYRLIAERLSPRVGIVDSPSPRLVEAARQAQAVLENVLEGPALRSVVGQPILDAAQEEMRRAFHVVGKRRRSIMPMSGAGEEHADVDTMMPLQAGPMSVGLLDGVADALDAALQATVHEFADTPMYAACIRKVSEGLSNGDDLMDGGSDGRDSPSGSNGKVGRSGEEGRSKSRHGSTLSPSGSGAVEPSFSQWFNAEKLNRYGTWQPRSLRLHLVDRQVLVHKSSTEAEMHNFDATDVARAVRVATEKRDQLQLTFQPRLEEREYDLRFEGGETARDDFVRMLQMLAGTAMTVEDQGEDYSSQGTGMFLTQWVGRGVVHVAIQPDARVMIHGTDKVAVRAAAMAAEVASSLGTRDPLAVVAGVAAKAGSAGGDIRSIRLTWRALLHPCSLDPTRVVLCPHGETAPVEGKPSGVTTSAPRSGRRLSSLIDIMGNRAGGPLWGAAHPGGADPGSMELIFSSPQARDRFAGLVRAVTEGIDIPMARATGVRRIAPIAAAEQGRSGATVQRLTREGLLVCAATWNVGDSKPPKNSADLWPWLPPGRFDIYAIGLQECSSLQAWVGSICDAISASDETAAGGGTAGGGKAGGAPGADANGAPADALSYVSRRPGNFALVASHSLWEMQLLVFAREDVARSVSQLKQSSVATGLGGIIGNKGGVACGMVLGGTTRLCFMTCHLAARATRLRTRASNFAEVLRRLEVGLTAQGTPANQPLHDYDHFFVMGDLNYRVDLGFHGSPTEFTTVQQHIDRMEFAPLEQGDQLVHQKVRGNVFAGFDEQPIRFAPTYRMIKGKALTYSNKRNQNMSWTDRVLWRTSGGLRGGVQPIFYASCFSLDQSDHRPVSAGVRVPMQQPYLHIDRGLGAGSARQVVLELGGVELYDALLSPDEQDAADADLAGADGAPVSRSQCPKGLLELAGPAAAIKAAAELASDKKAAKKGKGSAVAPPKPGSMPDSKSAAAMASEAQGVALDTRGIPRSCGPSGKRKGFDFKAGEGLFLTVSAPFVGATTASAVAPVLASAASSTKVARWTGNQLPHAVMRLADEGWLSHQHVLLTVRRAAGPIVGQAELPLLDAHSFTSDPHGPVAGLSLVRVLEHPSLLRSLATFLQKEQTAEHLAFLLVTRWYRNAVRDVAVLIEQGDREGVAAAMASVVGVAAIRRAAAEAAAAPADGKLKGKGKGKGGQGGAAALGLGGGDNEGEPGLGGAWIGHLVRRQRVRRRDAVAVAVQQSGLDVAIGDSGDEGVMPGWALAHVHAAARAIAQEFIGGDRPSGVNVPGAMSKGTRHEVLVDMLLAARGEAVGAAQGDTAGGGAWTVVRAAGVFDACFGEVLALLERDNFPRFQQAMAERRDGDRKKRGLTRGGSAGGADGGGLGLGASFCVQLVRDGRSVGSLRGRAQLLTVGASCCRAETARECRQLESRRQLLGADGTSVSLLAATSVGAGMEAGGGGQPGLDALAEAEAEGADDLELGSDDDEDLMADLLQGGSSLKKVEVAASGAGGPRDADLDPGEDEDDEDEDDEDD